MKFRNRLIQFLKFIKILTMFQKSKRSLSKLYKIFISLADQQKSFYYLVKTFNMRGEKGGGNYFSVAPFFIKIIFLPPPPFILKVFCIHKLFVIAYRFPGVARRATIFQKLFLHVKIIFEMVAPGDGPRALRWRVPRRPKKSALF